MRRNTSNPGSFEGPHLLALSEAEEHHLLRKSITRRLSLDCSGEGQEKPTEESIGHGLVSEGDIG